VVPPAGDGGSVAPIDRPVLEFLETRLRRTGQVEWATITDASGHLELRVVFAPGYYPPTVDKSTMSVRWYTNDDFKIHCRERYPDGAWECRWDRHPNPHNTRDHFHPPPAAPTPGDDASWPADHRDVVAHVLDEVADRVATLWDEYDP